MAVVTQGDIERLPGGRTGCPECTVAAAIHHQERRPEGIEVVLFLLLVIAATVLGVLGVALKKFVLPAGHGVIVLVAGLICVGARLGRGRNRPSR